MSTTAVKLLKDGRLNDVLSLLEDKVDKIEGKGLSTNDLTDELIDKINEGKSIEGILENDRTAFYVSDWAGNVVALINKDGISATKVLVLKDGTLIDILTLKPLTLIRFGETYVDGGGRLVEPIAIGTDTGFAKNVVAIGTGALKNIKTDGQEGGHDAGNFNTAVGHGALTMLDYGDHNTAVGWGASAGITTGCGNTSLGEDALCAMREGNQNTAIGNRAMQRNAEGNCNTVVGYSAMYSSQSTGPTGSYNVALGFSAGPTSGDADHTISIGSQTAARGRYSTAIGMQAYVSTPRTTLIGSKMSGTPHPLNCVLSANNIYIHFTDMTCKKLVFNEDGSVTWEKAECPE